MKKIFKKSMSIALAASLFASGNYMTMAFAAESTDNDEVTIQILATSDVHGRFVPYDYALNEVDTNGSYAQIYTAVQELRNDNTLLLDIGDVIQDNSADLFKNDELHPMIYAMNEIGYDTWTLGNHEFNYGMDVLKNVMSQSKATVLSGNVYNPDGSHLADSYKIFEKGGVKIAVIGMTTSNITRWDAENLKGYTVTNALDETKKVIEEIKDEVDVIIAAEHMGEESEYDVYGSGSKDITAECPEIDLFIAAHEHRNVEGNYNSGILTIENKNAGQTMGKVDITLKKNSDGTYEITDKQSKLIWLNEYEADAGLVEKLSDYHNRAVEDANQIIGEVTGDLTPDNEIPGIPQAQLEETAMINLINTVQMYYADADVSAAALFNTDASVKAGTLKKSDSALIYKYANTLYKMEMTGAQLKKFMEWSASYYKTYQDGDLTVAFEEGTRAYNYDMFTGVNYDINISKEAGNRIENLTKMDGTPVEDDDVLTVAVNNYRASSQLLVYGPIFQEGEELPKLLEIDVRGDLGGVRELIGDYIKNVKGGVIEPTLSNNWRITGNDWNEQLHDMAVQLVKEGKLFVTNSEDGRTPNIKAITEADVKSVASLDCNIEFDADGGDASKTSITATIGEKIGTLPTATRKGYKFKGWYTVDGQKLTANTIAEEMTVYAKWTKVSTGKTTVKSLTAKKQATTVKLKAVSNAVGYRVLYSTNKSFSNVKKVDTTSTSVTIKSLKSGKTYYVKARAYKKDSTGARVYGKVSAVKKVTVK